MPTSAARGVDQIDQVVRHLVADGDRRLGRTDVHAAVDGHRVDGHQLHGRTARDRISHGQGHRGLA
jgi:hypothetical protein